MELSVIIVNWNSAGYLRKCLKSIYSQTEGLELEVVVVDNASYDGSHEIVIQEVPGAKYIQSEKNLGFAKANNLGFTQSCGKFLLFLNPDTEIVGSAINIMLRHLKAIPDAGAVGCKLLNSDHTVQTTCIQRFPTILNQILNTDYLILRFPRFDFFGVKPLFFYRGKPEPVEVISGACLMVKREVFERVGMFGSDYFMYADDLDLCYKIAKTGHKSYYVGDASVIHHGGKSVGQTKVNCMNSVMKRESIKKMLARHKGRRTAFFYQVSMAAISVPRICLLLLFMPVAKFRGGLEGIKSSLQQWVKVLRWSLGMEAWASSPNWRQP